jgi:hypothetical protein
MTLIGHHGLLFGGGGGGGGGTDPLWASVVASWPLTADLVDLKNGYNLTASGTTFDTGVKRYASDAGSLYFDGTDYASRADTADLRLPTATSKSCIEFSFRPAGVAATRIIFWNRDSGATTGWAIVQDPSGGFYINGSAGASFLQTAGGLLSANTWYDVRVDIFGSGDPRDAALYLDGTRVALSGTQIGIAAGTQPFNLGYRHTAGDLFFVGHMAHVRITHDDRTAGAASYTPDGAPFPTS